MKGKRRNQTKKRRIRARTRKKRKLNTRSASHIGHPPTLCHDEGLGIDMILLQALNCTSGQVETIATRGHGGTINRGHGLWTVGLLVIQYATHVKNQLFWAPARVPISLRFQQKCLNLFSYFAKWRKTSNSRKYNYYFEVFSKGVSTRIVHGREISNIPSAPRHTLPRVGSSVGKPFTPLKRPSPTAATYDFLYIYIYILLLNSSPVCQ